MLTAVSLLPFLFCLGMFFVGITAGQPRDKTPQEQWRVLSCILLCGLLLNYLFIMVIGELRAAFILALVVGICNSVLVWTRYPKIFRRSFRVGKMPAFCFAIIAIFFAAIILLRPLYLWDARSIWFFQGKLIFYTGSLIPPGGWKSASYEFAHADYPKLIPVLAAQVSYLAGFWNEQLPKFSILLLILPALAVTFSFWKTGWGFFSLFVTTWVALAQELSGGMMDGLLAVYGLLAVLMLASWVTRRAELDLMLGVLLLGICLGLKNEGTLLVVACLVCVVPALLLHNGPHASIAQSSLVRSGIILAFAITAGGSWLVERAILGLNNDLQLGPGSIPIMIQRINDSTALKEIVQSTLLGSDLIYALFVGVMATALRHRFKVGIAEPLVCLIVAATYLLGIGLVYLATPYDLSWHLQSSADRATLLPTLLLLAPVILLLRDKACWQIQQTSPLIKSPETPPLSG